MVFDLNLPADTTVCGMSSWLVQVTVSPTFTFSSGGVKVKLSIVTLMSWARAPATPSCRRATEALVALLEVDAGNAEQTAQLGVLYFHGSRRRRGARRGLRERGRAGGVEGD